MNKEDILKEINNDVINKNYWPARSDCCDIDNQVFEDVILDNIVCYRMTFHNCIFRNVQFINNQVEWIEFNDCQFFNTTFTGKLQNPLLTLSNNVFHECKLCDFDLSGDQQSEIEDSDFEACIFANIKIEADLSILGGNFKNCVGNDVNCKMGELLNVRFCDSKFENFTLDAAIQSSSFNGVEIKNLCFEGVANKKNKFENCYVDNKLVEEQ